MFSGDLQLMAKYDFKVPIKTTVIYYDSDEDDKPSIEKEKCNDVAKNINSIFEKRTKIAENYTRDSNTVLDFHNQADILSMAQTANNIDYNQKIPTEDQNSNINQIAITTLQASSERHPLVRTPQIISSQNEDHINKTANKCLQTLLDTVSTHMIFITQAYKDYAVIAKTTTDRALLEMARNYYQNAKYNFFYLSFSAISNIMLPKENDKDFVEDFIENTIKLAHSKHLIVKHSDIRMLCVEMFKWTKSHIQNPLLSELLAKEPQPTVLTCNTNSYQKQGCNQETSSSDNICIFRSGPVDRQLIINVNSTAIQNNQHTMQQMHSTTHVPCPALCISPSALPPIPRVELWNDSNSRNNIQELKNFNSSYGVYKQLLNDEYEPNRGSKTKRKQPKRNHHPATPLQTSRPPSYYSTNTCHYETVMPQIQSENQITNPVYDDSTSVHKAQEEVHRSLSRDSGYTSLASNDQMVKAFYR